MLGDPKFKTPKPKEILSILKKIQIIFSIKHLPPWTEML
jgi:hypothetical protein